MYDYYSREQDKNANYEDIINFSVPNALEVVLKQI